MLVIVALANKTARIAWALTTKGGIYRAPTVHVYERARKGCQEGVRRSKDRYGAMSARQDQENQAHGERFERVPMMWT